MPASTTATSRTGQHERPPEATPRSVDDPSCDVCPHAVADHDAIGLRFFRATRNGTVLRGCVCRPSAR